MADEKDEQGVEEQAPPKKKGSSMKWIIIAVAAVVVLGGGGAGAYFFLFKSHSTSEKKHAEVAKPATAIFWTLDPFIVNLMDNEGERYLKVVMQFELADQFSVEELNIVKPKVRDTILDLLSAKSYREMMDPVGKQRLKDEIAFRSSSYLTKGKILKVYFMEFVIQ